MVDSFGGITPSDIKEITKIVKEKTTCPIGFHGHNNLQLGLINTLTAIEEGVDFVDATIIRYGTWRREISIWNFFLQCFLNED